MNAMGFELSAGSALFAGRMFIRFVAVSVSLITVATSSAYAATCDSLSHLVLPETTITLAKLETAETYKTGLIETQGPPLTNLPPFCRVAAEVRPTPDSRIRFEVWMPASEWNGKFMGVGNGGWSGEIWYPFMGTALRGNYATASTDTGHEGSFKDASFALGHPEKVVDFGYRAVHEMTVKAKAIIAAFYGDPPKFSYWQGCSSGGKQGLKEAQRFPSDYDGIIAGAPASSWVHLVASGVWIWQANHNGDTQVLSKEKMQVLHKAALDVCDSRDGVSDGVIENPQKCRFDPETVRCKGAATTSCLTQPEVEAAKKIYAGPKNPRTGEQIFPGLEPGSELGWWMYGSGEDPPIVASHFRYLVFKDASWSAGKLNFDSDITLADKLDDGLLTATDPNLKEFFSHGGKLILYHGWTDPIIAGRNTIDYYKSLLRSNEVGTETSVRLFMAPGMDHCAGGAGPSHFDLTTALSDWVEHGKPPEMILAAHLPDAPPAAHGPDRTRPLCAYPRIAKYKGTGSTDKANSFACMKE
jgi:feruloyl esterase